MTEDQYYPSPHGVHQLLNSAFNNGCDFNKYDPYVEKIRTLFVPSLEPRIYSCLETFVYPEDQEALSEPSYLKRCLDVAATWRKPVDDFSSKLGNRGYLESMLSQAVKYLIKDGLIDCFLNSIILNNRLNKVCRHLDAVGVEKDFLRYLAVWNYINERDYWIEDDRKTTISMSGSSYDSMESYGDLDVQVGSALDTHRTNRCLKKACKRRVPDDSSEVFDKTANDFSENCNRGICSSLQFPSRLSIDSNNPERSKSSGVRSKLRCINQTYPCRSSNCPTYRKQYSDRGDWEGKTLKMRVCKICPSTSDCGLAKPLRLSKSPLPCKCDDIIAEIVKADQSVPRSSWITTRRKLQAGVTKICCRINETLGKRSREDVRRCRFHCEILPGFVSFKLFQRQSNGCKACLFTDRVTTDKIDGQITPRGSFVSQKSADIEYPNSHKPDFPIFESTAFNADEDLQIVSSNPVENKIKADSRFATPLRLPENKLDATKEQSRTFIGEETSNHLNGNDVNDQTCNCNPSLADGLEYLNNEEKVNLRTSRVEDSERTAVKNNLTESPGKAVVSQSSGNVIDGQTCSCDNGDENKLDTFNSETEKTRSTNCVESFETTKAGNLGKELTQELSFNRLSGNNIDDQMCLCDISSPDTFDMNAPKKNQESNCVEFRERSVENFESPNCQESRDLNSQESQKSNSSVVISDPQKISCMENKKTEPMLCNVKNDQKVLVPQLNLSHSCSVRSPKGMETEIQHDDTSCECPLDSCECIDKCNDEHELEECDSQCSCDTCGVPDRLTSVNRLNDVSPLVNPVQPSKFDSRIPNLVKSILIDKSLSFDTASNVQLQPNRVESQANSWESHHPKTNQDTSIKSRISFQSDVTNEPFIDTEIKEIGPHNNSHKFLQIQSEKPTEMKESKKNSPLAKSPIRIDTGRASSSKSQRINISIELYPKSESSDDKSLKNKRKFVSPSCQKESTRSRCVLDSPSKLTLRCHSADARSSRKQAISQSEKNTKDECLRHLRRTNACVHSPPRPLESRDYLPPFEPPSRMRNPIVYGMSKKSSECSTCKLERQSTRQRKTRKNRESKYPNENRCCNQIQENIRINKTDEFPKLFPRTTTKTDRNSPSIIRNNLCHAFSASSVDRMKHLIKTKLRRILLERDKATNTPKTTLTNGKYRVSVPNGKTKCLPYTRHRCHTIWECRSVSDSAHTSRTYGLNGRTGLSRASQGDEIKSLFYSKTNAKILSSEQKNVEGVRDFDSAKNVTCYCLENSDQSVVSSRIKINERLVGGSDGPCKKGIDHEFRCIWKQHQKSVPKIRNKDVEHVSNYCDDRSSSKSVNRSCTGDLGVVEDVELSRLINSADCNGDATLNESRDQIKRCPGKLDWSGNSTSRHIYLYEYGNFESSIDEEDKKSCDRKIGSPIFKSLSICKQRQAEKRNSRKLQKAHQSRCKNVNSRPCKRQFIEEPTRNICTPSCLSSKIRAKSNSGCQKGFSKLDQDLRSKLLQYVSLCKNVKYSLLKMLRPDDIYEVSRTSVPCCDRYKFGDT